MKKHKIDCQCLPCQHDRLIGCTNDENCACSFHIEIFMKKHFWKPKEDDRIRRANAPFAEKLKIVEKLRNFSRTFRQV